MLLPPAAGWYSTVPATVGEPDVAATTANGACTAVTDLMGDLMGDLFALPCATLEPEHAYVPDSGTGDAAG
jgi:hypothetical protein